MRRCSTHDHWPQVGWHVLRVMLAGLAAALLLGGCGSSPGGVSSTAANAQAPSVGTVWEAQDTSSAGSTGEHELNSVAFVDTEHGWAVGYEASSATFAPIVLATSDGGASWKAQDAASAGSNGGLSSVAFVDAQHGWAVGGYAADMTAPAILATTDGGTTWEAQDASSAVMGAGLLSVTFVDPAHGWAVGTDLSTFGPIVIATSDGGATWRAQDASSAVSEAKLASVAFSDARHGWAVGSNTSTVTPVVIATSDGGASWKAQDARSAGTGAQLRSVTFIDAKHGWAVGESKSNGAYAPVILVTRNGGATWTAQDAGSAGGGAGLLSVAFVDAAHGWAAGVDATAVTPVILGTSDGGATWEAQDASSAGSTGGIDSLAFVDAEHGWASGYDASNKTLTPVILTIGK